MLESHEIEQFAERVRIALAKRSVVSATKILAELHPADRAELFVCLTPDQQRVLIKNLDFLSTANLLEQLGEDDALQIASELPTETLAQVLDEMSPDGAADILGELPLDQASEALSEMEEPEEVKELLKYSYDTAGGLMSPVVVSLNVKMRVSEAFDVLRKEHPDSATPYYLYVVGERGELLGVVSLRALITAELSKPISELMNAKVMSVSPELDQEKLASEMNHYGLLALPVVDSSGKLLGTVRSQDLVSVIEEEATEDILRLGGVADGEVDLWSPLGKSVSRRLPWLMINLLTAFLAAWVVSLFEATIGQLAILAVFQGIIAGQGGNAGTQTLTIVVRGLALGAVVPRDILEALKRELLLGVINGVAVGLAVGLGAYLWIGNGWLGAITGLALLGNLIAAAAAGTVVPLALKLVRLDPALASGVLVTTVTDCVGFGLFLYLASITLEWIR